MESGAVADISFTNSTDNHAHTEVYLGQPGAQDAQFDNINSWLKEVKQSMIAQSSPKAPPIPTTETHATSWQKTFGGSNYGNVESIRQTSDGGYIIAGETRSFGAGQSDIWLLKTDANGNKLWDNIPVAADMAVAPSTRQTSDGGYIITGFTNSYAIDGSVVWLIKTDVNGNKIWDKTFAREKANGGYSVQQTGDGGYIITGATEKTESSQAKNYDVWLIKTDANGNKIWDKTFGGSGDDRANKVQQTSDGGYVIIGYIGQFSKIDDGKGVAERDVWLIKTDANGNKIWDKTFGGSGCDDEGYSAQQTNDEGYIILAGYNGGLYCGTPENIGLIKTDNNGNTLWYKVFSGFYTSSSDPIQQTNDGGYIIAGNINSNDTLKDIYIIKTDANGNV